VCHLTDASRPAGAVLKAMRSAILASSISVNQTRVSCWVNHAGQQWSKTTGQILSTTTPVLIQSAWAVPGGLTDAEINALTLSIDCDPLVTEARFYEGYVDLIWAEMPSSTATGPTGTWLDSTVLATWSAVAGADSDGITGYRTVLYSESEYSSTSFVPGQTSSWDSGSQWSTNQYHWFYGVPDGNYRQYSWVFQIINGYTQWSAVSYTSFTVDLPGGASAAPTFDVLAFGVDQEAQNTITVIRDLAGPQWDTVEVQRNVDVDVLGGIGHFDTGYGGVGAGWTAWDFGSPTGRTNSLLSTDPHAGQFQRVQGTLDAAEYMIFSRVIPCRGGDVIAMAAMGRANAMPANTTARMVIHTSPDETAVAGATFPYNASPGIVDFNPGSEWDQGVVSGTAPLDARTAMVQLEVLGLTGASGAVVSFDWDDVVVTVNADGWSTVKTYDGFVPPDDEVSLKDYEVAPRVNTRYRARASNGSAMSPWRHAPRYADWDVEKGVWFKDPNDSTRNVLLRLAKKAPKKLNRRRGWFRPVGSPYAIGVYDVRDEAEYALQVSTYNHEEADAFEAVTEAGLLMIHAAASYRFASGWYLLGDVHEAPLSDKTAVVYQEYAMEVARAEPP
jgi:hypothetical protein